MPDPRFIAVREKYAGRYPGAAAATDGQELVEILIRGRQREEPTLSRSAALLELMRDRELRAIYH